MFVTLCLTLFFAITDVQELHAGTPSSGIGSVSATHRLLQQKYDIGGTCNTTSNGHVYADSGHYAPMMLRGALLPFQSDIHRKWPTSCYYRFIGTSNQRILLQLKYLRIGRYDPSTRSCLGGRLSLYDGTHEPGNHRFPPNTFCGRYEGGTNGSVFTSGHVAEVELSGEPETVDDDDVWSFAMSFKYVNMDKEVDSFPKQIVHSMRPAHDAAYICTWLMRLEDCENDHDCPILSPGYPAAYPPNTECSYHVTSQDVNIALQIRFSDPVVGGVNERKNKPREFDLRQTDRCSDDYLEIHDGPTVDSPMIGRFCGNWIPDVTSSSGHLYMVFVSGPATPPYGHAGYHGSLFGVSRDWFPGGVKTNEPCDWSFNVSEGSVASPDHWLPPNAKCTYTFQLLPRHHLDVIINVYGLGTSCSDRVDLIQGHQLVRRICSEEPLSSANEPPGIIVDRRKPSTSGSSTSGTAAVTFTSSPISRQVPRHQSPTDARQLLRDGATVEYQLRDRVSVSVVYTTDKGQWQSTPDRGFWMSFRQRGNSETTVDVVDELDMTSSESGSRRQRATERPSQPLRQKSSVDRRADHDTPFNANRQPSSSSSSSSLSLSSSADAAARAASAAVTALSARRLTMMLYTVTCDVLLLMLRTAVTYCV